MILEESGDIDIVGEAQDGASAVRLTAELDPDVILMDVRMPGVDGIEATRQIVARDPAARVLILTTFDLDEYAFTALRAGASGFVLKDVPLDELARAIRSVASGDAVVSPRITRKLLDIYASRLPGFPGGSDVDQLTPREREVLLAMATGLSNSEIAAKLTVSETTVKTHVGSILGREPRDVLACGRAKVGEWTGRGRMRMCRRSAGRWGFRGWPMCIPISCRRG
jgi:DNA-binding NarL/FixJ family response regulator